MNTLFKSVKSNGILTAVLAFIYGLMLIIWPEASADTICYAIGAAVIVVGVVYIILYIKKDVVKEFYKKELVIGLGAISVGAILLVNVGVIKDLIPMLLGIFVMFSGFVKLQNAFDLLRLKQKSYIIILILALLNILFACLLIFRPDFMRTLLFRLIGIALCYSAITDVFTVATFSRWVKKNESDAKESDIIEEDTH